MRRPSSRRRGRLLDVRPHRPCASRPPAPEPDVVLDLGVVRDIPQLVIRRGGARPLRCHTRCRDPQRRCRTLESAEAVDGPTGQDEAAARREWWRRSWRCGAVARTPRAPCHPWSRSPCALADQGRPDLHGPRASSRLDGSPLRRQYAAMAASWRVSLRHNASISGWRSAVVAARCKRYRSRKALGSGALPRR